MTTDDTLEVVASTGARTQRDGAQPGGGWGPYYEALDVAGADLSRMNGNAPLLLDHQPRSDLQVGVVESARVENGQIVARVRFSKEPKAQAIKRDVADRVRRAVSIGYRVDEWRDDTRKGDRIPTYTATRFEIIELSIVPAGADRLATFRSSTPEVRTRSMTIANTSPAAEVAPVTNLPDPLVIERERTSGILLTARKLGVDMALAGDLIADGTDLATARQRLVDANADRQRATAVNTVVMGGVDHTDPARIVERMSGWLAHRLSGGRLPVPESSREFAGSSLLDLGRGLIQARGDRGWLGTSDVAARLTRTGFGGMHTTSDFALLAGTSANRALLDRFQQLMPALVTIARRQTAPDFRTINRIRLGEGSGLALVNEHGEVTRGTVSERGESYVIKSYSKIWALSRQLIVNDDLGAFEGFISEVGRKAAVLLGDTLYSVLSTNAAMSDGIALFHANHGNLAASGTTVDTAALSLARIAMRAQTGIDGGLIEVKPKYLVVGPAKETAADQCLAEIAAAAAANVNIFAKLIELVVEPRITGNSWYVTADPSLIHGIEYAELDGSRPMGGTGPQIETEMGFDVQGLQLKCTYDVGAGAVAHQPLYYNPGA